MKLIQQKTKTLVTKDNGRSSDAVSPNFIYGCLGGCMKSYCYVGRFNPDKVYINTNTDDILKSINDWLAKQPAHKTPNQIDPIYYTIDIGCSTDIPLMTKHYNWQTVFDFFNDSDYRVKSTFATKYPTMFKPEDYNLNPDRHRIRVSLMPQSYSDILEPNTDSIENRIDSIKRLSEHLEVHINFSPIIYHDGWLDEYNYLFACLKKKEIDVKCECIFLTYNDKSYANASDAVNALLWKPEIQEKKDSNYAPDNLRYKWNLKNEMVHEFVSLYDKYFNRKNIRYIF